MCVREFNRQKATSYPLNNHGLKSPYGQIARRGYQRFLDHTGDAGIFVPAPDLKELFARAAWAMFYLITDTDTIRVVDVEYVELLAPDLSALMIRWLSELNYRHVTDHRLFRQFEIIQINENSLAAVVRGEKLDPARHEIFTEIKAVTFHAMRIERSDRGWEAQIIFDL